MADLNRVFELEEAILRLEILINQHLPFTNEYSQLKREVNHIIKELKIQTYEV